MLHAMHPQHVGVRYSITMDINLHMECLKLTSVGVEGKMQCNDDRARSIYLPNIKTPPL